jgi:hypothetical protein
MVYPGSYSPIGAVIYVSSQIGRDGRSHLSFPPGGVISQGPQSVDPSHPLASVFGPNGALSFCRSGRGDLIICYPGHTESTAFGAASPVPANTTILGIGYGSLRPTFSWSTSGALNLYNAGVQISNCILDLSTSAAPPGYGIVLGSNGCQLVNCRIVQSSATGQATNAILIGTDDAALYQCEIDASAGAGGAQGIIVGTGAGSYNRTILFNNYLHGNFTGQPIGCVANMIECNIQLNTFVQRNSASSTVLALASSTGVIAYNNFATSTPGSLAACIAGGASPNLTFLQNFVYTQKAGGPFSGILCPAAGTIP